MFKRSLLLSVVGLSLATGPMLVAAGGHFNQSSDFDYQEQKSAPMTEGQKMAASAVVGMAAGVIGAKALEKSTELGGFLGVVMALYALYLVKQSREDAVGKALGEEYVGVSALAAVATGIAVYRPNAAR